MPMTQLVDVIALSAKECERPIQCHLVYATPDNFLGQRVAGYTPDLTDFTVMTKDAAIALCRAQDDLCENHKLGLHVYDAYRPKRAVQHFLRWSEAPATEPFELKRKIIHYPHIEKNRLFELGYVAEDSQHCYGHTVDLVLLDENNNEINLGACFDFMDTLSHTTNTEKEIGEEAYYYRKLLSETMQKFGFVPYIKEFWHFSYKNKALLEPLDLVITPDLRSLNVY